MRDEGGLLIALGGGLGLLIALYNYFAPTAFLAPQSSIAGTPGAALMIFATACLLVAGLVLAGRRRNAFVTGFFLVGALAGALGAGFAAWLLDSPATVALMGICLVGWALRVLTGPEADTRRA